MWLFRLIKKLIYFVLFILIVGGMMVVFYQFLWFKTDSINVDLWVDSTWTTTPAEITGALTGIPGINEWYQGIVSGASNDILKKLAAGGIPLGFALLFGISVNTIVSMIFHFIMKLFSKRKERKQIKKTVESMA